MPYYSNQVFLIKDIEAIEFEEGQIIVFSIWTSQFEAWLKMQDKLLIKTKDDLHQVLISTNKSDLKVILKNIHIANIRL